MSCTTDTVIVIPNQSKSQNDSELILETTVPNENGPDLLITSAVLKGFGSDIPGIPGTAPDNAAVLFFSIPYEYARKAIDMAVPGILSVTYQNAVRPVNYQAVLRP